jgi:hypothetical protein
MYLIVSIHAHGDARVLINVNNLQQFGIRKHRSTMYSPVLDCFLDIVAETLQWMCLDHSFGVSERLVELITFEVKVD